MADLRVNFAGIESPNPFWLASGPPTNTYGQVAKAFDAGWGGAVWKTIGEPIINVFSRYGSVDLGPTRMMGLNNIELISDRPIADNQGDRGGQAQLSETRGNRLAHGRVETPSLARDGQANSGHRS